MKRATPQPSILADVSPVGRSLTFRAVPGSDVAASLRSLRDSFDVNCGIVGIGLPAVLAVGGRIEGLQTFPALSGAACSVPSTQGALWVMLKGADRGIVFDFAQSIKRTVAGAFVLTDVIDTFVYQGGRDLTRFEDGTENPRGSRASRAAVVRGNEALNGSSFVAVQKWIHDLTHFWSFSSKHRDEIIGRRADTNEEIDDAPAFAHVKRTAQESYDPPAFMLRRSMPWASGDEEGLLFISFVDSLDKFERMMRRMTGLDDGVVDGLFSFSRPTTGGFYWCPPVARRRLDLKALGV